MPRAFLLLIALLLLTVSGAALSAPHFAHAEDEEKYVDLYVEIEPLFTLKTDQTKGIAIHLGNGGNRTAHGIEVEFRPKSAPTIQSPDLPDGTWLECRDEDTTDNRCKDSDGKLLTLGSSENIPVAGFIWKIPQLPSQYGIDLILVPRVGVTGPSLTQYSVEATSASHESDTRLYDNSDQIRQTWSLAKNPQVACAELHGRSSR